MIIAIANQGDHWGGSVVAKNLAVLRARSGRKVLLVDTDLKKPLSGWSTERRLAGLSPQLAARALSGSGLQVELESVLPRHNDILIGTPAEEAPASRTALIAARLAIVPVRGPQLELSEQYKMIARLSAARNFNPGLRIVLVALSDRPDPLPEHWAAMRAYASRVMAATLAECAIHLPVNYDYGQGRCACDAETCDPDIAARWHALYDVVFARQRTTALSNWRVNNG